MPLAQTGSSAPSLSRWLAKTLAKPLVRSQPSRAASLFGVALLSVCLATPVVHAQATQEPAKPAKTSKNSNWTQWLDPYDRIDPLEPFNRSMYQLNDALDRNILRPVASTYVKVAPRPVRAGLSNFFDNLEDAWSGINNLLQGKGADGLETLARFGVNTVAGFFGLFDVATPLGIERHSEDFGQTLGAWGVGSGPYLVLPLLGPSTLRDTAALRLDIAGDLVTQVDNIGNRNSLYALRVVNRRAEYLKATDMLEQSAFDPYTFVRDAFVQRRRNQVYDGNPPELPQDEAPAQLEERYDLPEDTPTPQKD